MRPLDGPRLAAALDQLAATDPALGNALAQIGYPLPRLRAPGFATLLQIMVAQQISTRAAAAIWQRLAAACGVPPTPAAFLQLDDAACRAIGLSGRKVLHGRALAQAVRSGALPLTDLAHAAEADIIAAITALPGFGRWSAEIYMLFALGRIDGWPAGDLAQRPNRVAMTALGEAWRPCRGAGALFLWHLYGATTLELAGSRPKRLRRLGPT
jgi:DNA-3-methyladenine glycosylase II